MKVLEVDEIVRVGWRNYFVYELQNSEEKSRIFSKFIPLNGTDFLELNFKKNLGKINAKFGIQGAEKKDMNKSAIIFDIDCFENFKSPITQHEAQAQLKLIRETLNSDELLLTINSLLSTTSSSQ